MTVGELKYRILEDYGGEASIEDIINAVALIVEDDRAAYAKTTPEGDGPNPLVLDCIDACIHHLHDASFAFYASLK